MVASEITGCTGEHAGMENIKYVVYVNHPSNKAIAHSTNCTWFIHRKRDETHNGYWSIVEREPFRSTGDALDYARNTGKKNIDTCAFCIGEER